MGWLKHFETDLKDLEAERKAILNIFNITGRMYSWERERLIELETEILKKTKSYDQ